MATAATPFFDPNAHDCWKSSGEWIVLKGMGLAGEDLRMWRCSVCNGLWDRRPLPPAPFTGPAPAPSPP